MSEYQYYEFLALDKALTDQQRAELRELSSRAVITATRFVNEYHYGDFRGSPEKLMELYYDAFLYLANWGTRRLMFRLPRELLDAEVARRYCYTDVASVTATSDHVIISFFLDREPEDDWVEGEGWLASMVQARSDLAAGDLRLLYLGWLLSVQRSDDFDEDDEDPVEPPVPAGLAELSPSLSAIAEFLGIYEDLVAVAAEASPPLREPASDRLAGWIAALPAAEKDTLLTKVAGGEGARVQALLQRRFREGDRGATIRSGAPRTASELLDAASDRLEERARAEELRPGATISARRLAFAYRAIYIASYAKVFTAAAAAAAAVQVAG